MSYLETKFDGAVYTITINKPETLNALNSALIEELGEQARMLAKRADVRVVVLTGTGRSFVAGADISEMAELNRAEAKAFGERGAKVFRQIELLPMPVVAAVNGFALGGGCELAMACDIRIASEKAKFGQPETGLGIMPGFSGTVRLPRLVGSGMAKLLICTGRTIDAAEAFRIGLADIIATEDDFEGVVYDTAKAITRNAPVAVRASKKSIDIGLDTDMDIAIDNEIKLFAACFDTQDQKAGMRAFLAKTKTDFKGE